MDSVNKWINNFLENNKDYLNQVINEINIIFSKESLEYLAKAYGRAFNRQLKKLTDEIEYNKNLSQEYFDGMAELMTNNDKII